jgi:hypothetical protein
MLSSTSSSEPKSITRAGSRSIALVLAGILVIGVGAEALARIVLGHVSRIEQRIEREYKDALSLTPVGPSGKPTMLLVGNSLLLEGVDLPYLQEQLSSKYDVRRLVVEQTEYLELYYVMRTLFRRGSRPHDVVLCLGVGHLIGDGARGEFTARYEDTSDLVSLARREHLDATTATNYFFGHWSGWYGMRVELRKWLLGRIMPDIGALTSVLGMRAAPPLSEPEVQRKSTERIGELKALCDEYGVRLTLLIPPGLSKEDYVEDVVTVGRQDGVRVLVPIEAGSMDKSLFRDGFHLTPTGAKIFTSKLAPVL